jgi:N6-adenosine-specific RNA methylase IME4
MTDSNVQQRYRTILADPPWNIVQTGSRGAERHYALMSMEQVCALRVDRLTAEDAHLWLW